MLSLHGVRQYEWLLLALPEDSSSRGGGGLPIITLRGLGVPLWNVHGSDHVFDSANMGRTTTADSEDKVDAPDDQFSDA